MQNLFTVVFFMISLSLANSLTRCRFRVTAASRFAYVDISSTDSRLFFKYDTCRSTKIKHFCSTSSPSGPGNESNTSRQLKRKLVRESANSPTQNLGGSRDQRNFPRQNLSGRRIPDSERVVSTVIDGKQRLPKSPPKDAFEEFMMSFRVVLRTREYIPAMALYKKMKEIKYPLRESVLTGLLSICQKKEHLEYAIQIFTDFLDAGLPLNESAYMSLIRCYSDNGEIDNALRLIEEMNLINIEPKLRTYHPVLEAVCKNNDFDSAMKITRQMHKSNVIPRSEQLTLLLEVSASSGALDNSETREQVDQLLLSASHDLLGMDTLEMRRVVSAFSNLTSQEVVEEGILVETRDDLPGEILDINSSSSTSVVTAMNTTFTDIPILLTDTTTSPFVIDNTVPIGFDYMNNNVEFEPDVYTIASETEALGGVTTGLRNRRARLVDISSRSCLCPNCGAQLIPLLLDEEERKRVRLGLMKIASTSSMNQLKNIQAFGDWLKTQKEFKYIIDGANVAYNHQNFENGKFSYRQIELVVNKMLARQDGKVLVLLPYSYAQKIVPNSSKQRGKKNITYVSAADQRIVQRFEEEGMLYLVPQGADDDWYWIYSTVAENRKSIAYVITNDLMRDHRLAFLEPRPFIRWRTTQVINFRFSKAAREDTVDPETYIIDPGKYSREIQRGVLEEGPESIRWHIPAADRRAWLCLVTENPNSLSSTTSSSPSSTGSPTSSRVDHEDALDTALLVPSIENKIGIKHNTGFVPQAPRRLY